MLKEFLKIFFAADGAEGGTGLMEGAVAADSEESSSSHIDMSNVHADERTPGHADDPQPLGDAQNANLSGSPEPGGNQGPGVTGGRPDNVPEAFWDYEAGKVKENEMANSYNDLRKKMNNILNERGETPEDYNDYLKDFKPPIRAKASGDQAEGDKFTKFGDMTPADPVFQALAKFAKAGNMSKAQFTDGLQDVMEGLEAFLPEQPDTTKEMELLGENGEHILKVNSSWINSLMRNGILNEAERNKLADLGSTALGVQLTNKLRQNSGEKPIPVKLSSEVTTGAKTPAECQALMGVEVPGKPGVMLMDQETPEGKAHRELIEKSFAETFGTELEE